MADSETKVPQVLLAPASPLWYHAMMCALGGLILGLLIAFGFVLRDHFQADGMTLVYREARAPLIQYRLEKGAWPAKFDFRVPPADLAAFGFTKVVQPALDKASVNGTWTFTPDGPAGKGVPAVVFTPSSPDASTQRILLVVDGRLDDGEPTKGLFRVSETAAAFTVKAE
jgi:hypothetical protein